MKECDNCAAKNRNTAMYCQECGAPLGAPSAESHDEDAPVLDDEAIDTLEMMPDDTSETGGPAPDEPGIPGAVPEAEPVEVDEDPLGAVFADLESAKYRLEVLTGPHARQTALVETGTPVTANSTPGSALCLGRDEFVSRVHASLSVEHGCLFVKDEGSANGTYVRVRDDQEVNDGDILLFGWTQVRVTREG